jgi:MFS family permease
MYKTLLSTLASADTSVWRLALGETLVWAALYYVFPALLLHWEQDQGWSRSQLSLALTTALVLSALSAPLTGRLIDRGYGRLTLTLSAIVGGLSLTSLAFVHSFTAFFAIWVLIGISMAGCLYEPCFAYLTHCRPLSAKRTITVVTLAAGFASTLAFPLANALADVYGWRATVVTFGVIVVFIAAPLLWFGAKSPRGFRRTHCEPQEKQNIKVIRRPVFWLLALAFTSTALTHGMLMSHLLPLLDERGVPQAMAILTASLIGPMQVVGRVVMLIFDRHVSIFFFAGLSFVFLALASSTLFVAGTVIGGLVCFAILQGSGYGVTSITKPTVTVNILGRTNFGAISGALAVPYMMAYAFAPTLSAEMWKHGGYDLVVATCIVLPTLGLSTFVAAVRTKPG